MGLDFKTKTCVWTVLSGGLPDDGQPGYMFPLTIVTGVEEGVRLVDEEQFGPVLPIMKYTSEDEVRASYVYISVRARCVVFIVRRF